MTGAKSRRKGHDSRIAHGHCRNRSESPTYKSFRMMHARCSNPNYTHYAYYGGRGISVCAEWSSFEAFLADMGERPDGLTLDRIDSDGNYCAANCRWASRAEQVKNRRPRLVREINGERLTTVEAIAKFGAPGVTKDCVERRVRRLSWSFEAAVQTSPLPSGRPPKGGTHAR